LLSYFFWLFFNFVSPLPLFFQNSFFFASWSLSKKNKIKWNHFRAPEWALALQFYSKNRQPGQPCSSRVFVRSFFFFFFLESTRSVQFSSTSFIFKSDWGPDPQDARPLPPSQCVSLYSDPFSPTTGVRLQGHRSSFLGRMISSYPNYLHVDMGDGEDLSRHQQEVIVTSWPPPTKGGHPTKGGQLVTMSLVCVLLCFIKPILGNVLLCFIKPILGNRAPACTRAPSLSHFHHGNITELIAAGQFVMSLDALCPLSSTLWE